MLLTDKLLGFLNRVFSKDPDQFLAFRIDYDGGMSWKVFEGRLYTNVSGGSGTDLNIDLSAYTLSTLAAYIATQAGYSVSSNVTDSRAILTAQILIDGTNSPAASNGNCLYAYSSLTWSYMHANAMQLVKAKTDIVEMLKQMSLQSAESEWLDDLGDYYGVRRLAGEPDTIYVDRILLTIIRPKGNNIALAMAIETLTKKTGAVVVDAPMTTVTQHEYRHGAARYDGVTTRAVQETSFYGQFDVTANFDLLAAENIADLLVRIRAAVEQFRDAGTKLRQVALSGSISDTARAGSDTSDIALTQALMSDEYIGVRSRHDGTVMRGGLTVSQLRMRNRAGFVYDGSVRRNVADVVSNSATAFYGADIDPATIIAYPYLSDSWLVEAPYVGMIPRDGTFTRTGVRDSGVDKQAIALSADMSDVATEFFDATSFTANPTLTDEHFIRERSRHDGTVQRRGLVPNPRRMRSRSGFYFDGSVLRSEANFVPDSATDYYGSDIDPVSVAANAALSDSWSADLTYVGFAPRNGVLSRSGLRGVGLDGINLTVTRTAFHNGKFQRTGFPYSGRISEII